MCVGGALNRAVGPIFGVVVPCNHPVDAYLDFGFWAIVEGRRLIGGD